jgi:rhamnogalacturonan endolyase
MARSSSTLAFAIAGMCTASAAFAVPLLERLDRGVVAVRQDGQSNFVSWRLLGNEPADTAFHVFRQDGDAPEARLTDAPITGATSMLDSKPRAKAQTRYTVRPVQPDGVAGNYTLPADATVGNYISIPLKTPDGYVPNDASAGSV